MNKTLALHLALALVACGDTTPDDENPLPSDSGIVDDTGDSQVVDTETGETETDPTDSGKATDSDTDPTDSGEDTSVVLPTDTDTDTDTDPVLPTGGDTSVIVPTGDTGDSGDTGHSGDTETGDTAPPIAACTFDLAHFAYPTVGAPNVEFWIYDEAGNEVYSRTFVQGNGWSDQTVLPSGNYYSVVKKDGGLLWDDITIRHTATQVLEATVNPQVAGIDVQWMQIDCADDTAWVEDTAWSEPDVAPTLPPYWEDDGTNGDCAYALQVVGNYDSYSNTGESGFVLYDDQRNVITSRNGSTWPDNNQDTEVLNLSSGRYLIDLIDTNNDGWNGSFLRLVDGTGDIVDTIELESGGQGYHYLNVDCPTDTAAYDPWDTDPDPTDIDTGWYLGEQYNGCPVVFAVNAPNTYIAPDMSFSVLDSNGNEVYSSSDAWLMGLTSSSEVQYAYTALPEGDYSLILTDSGYSAGWGVWEFVRMYGENGGFIGGGGHYGPNADMSYPVTVECGGDTGSWYEDEIIDLTDDTGWGDMNEAWRDTDLAETCGYMMEVITPYNASGGGWEIHDLEGHVLYSVAPGDMTQGYAVYRTPIELPTGGYKLKMTDQNGSGFNYYSVPDNFRLLDADGNLVEEWNMGGYGISQATEYFLLDCADDTDVAGWDTGWCEPILDSGNFASGACAAAIHVVGKYDVNTMGVRLTNNDGEVVADIQPGDLIDQGDHYIPVNLTSNGYHMELYSSDNTTWSYGALVEIIGADGACIDDEVLVEAQTLDSSNSIGGQRDVYFTHSCDEDTSGEFAWDSGWCEPVLDTAEIPTGACGYVVHMRATSNYDADELQVTIKDSDGNQVWQLAAGDLTAAGDYYFPVNLPSDGYEIVLEDFGTYSQYWASGDYVEIIPTSNECLEAEPVTGQLNLENGLGGIKSEYVVLNCEEDTGDEFAWDSAWCEPVLDTASEVTGTCGMVALVYAGYDYASLEATLTDSQGNVVFELNAGDLDRQGYHYLPFNAPTEGYTLHMSTAHSYNDFWANNGYIQFMSADGACVDESTATEQFNLLAFGERTEYLTFDCEDDTAEFAWDSGWCPGVLDTADIPTGDCAYVVEVGAGYDYTDMVVNLVDADGNEILDIAAGDGQLSKDTIHYFPVNLPSNGYTLTLEDNSTYSTYWDSAAYVRIVPADGACLDEELASERYSVHYDGLEIVNFEVECGDDTASFGGWDTGWCGEELFGDTAIGLTGCEQLLQLTTWYSDNEMQLEITDDAGNVVFSVDGATDFAAREELFYAVDLPTGDYTMTLTDTQGDSWIESYGIQGYKAEATLYYGNGTCMSDDVITGPHTNEDLDGKTGTPESQSFTFSVVCDADTAVP